MEKPRNQGEGDRRSARRYDRHLEDFVAEGKVDDAARNAREFVTMHPAEAERAEREAKAGPKTQHSDDGIVARGRRWFERIRHAVRERLGR
ncbi:MAG TPA: hypothetical protein VHN14_21745 [Kofleriaceae bacterium]|jgi:hypothetical protein|nr:hypothetical protein [Kofleriaceae bacterium]